MAKTEPRHPGRRSPADPKIRTMHEKLIKDAQKQRRIKEAEASDAADLVAKRISKAMKDGVQTNLIATWIGNSRQMVYKLVRERVDGKPLGSKAAQNGATKKRSKKRASAKRKPTRQKTRS